MIDYIVPLLAALIALSTRGCYRYINYTLACLLIFIFGYEEYVLSPDSFVFDSYWHDVIMIFLYGTAALMFHKLGGRIQLILASTGVALHIVYGLGWLIPNYTPEQYYYEGVLITLNIIQLLAAHKGQLWSILYKKTGAYYELRSDHNGSNHNSIHRNHP